MSVAASGRVSVRTSRATAASLSMRASHLRKAVGLSAGRRQFAFDSGGGTRGYNDPTSPSFGGGAYRNGGHGGGGSFNTNRHDGGMRGRRNDFFEGHNTLQPIHWESVNLEEFKKDLYVEHSEVETRSPEASMELVESMKATIKGRGSVPGPVSSFEHMRSTFGDKLLEELQKAGFDKPSPIQKFAWPLVCRGRDTVGIAQTGSGKTLGFLLPAFAHILQQRPLAPGEGPVCLVMAPTRELVQQINEEAQKFGSLSGIKTAVAYGGGGSRQLQANVLRSGPQLVVATPGRLMDFVSSGAVNLRRVTYLVLDEADRMLDMGFEPSIRKIVGQTRPDRQTVLFSATWPRDIQSLARDFCKEDPTLLRIGSQELQCNPDVTQIVEVIPEMQRMEHLVGIFEKLKDSPDGNAKCLIFCAAKRTADQMEANLRGRRIPCAALHGDKDQTQRERLLRDFKKGVFQVMVATDVAQRGLDISDVKYVINYDLPKTIHDYVHRIGRTGRAGAKGTAVTYFSWEYYDPAKLKFAQELCKAMTDVDQTPPAALTQIAQSAMRNGGGGGTGGGYGGHDPRSVYL
ncbi:unnamed protein product [Amoebophrya sp. A25]|nr:unnamed protein product [Amoebophrya sp. A25]|eukprot:GSA25T00005214001.1